MGGGVSGTGGTLRLNERAWQIADAMAANAEALRVAVQTLPGGARVIDAGVEAWGGFGAGRALAEICTAGLADIAYPPVPIGGETWPGVRVWTDHPAVSCMASQYAGWAIQVGKYFAMGSGPLRAHARVEKELFAQLGCAERAERGVLVLETRTLPTYEVASWGGQARYTVQADDAELAELVPKIPASASKDYGTPFYDIFKRYDSDFYKIDPLLFSPAEVWLTSVQSGKTYHAGHVNPEVLRASLLES